ncbi:MAG: hypothetical protein H0Z28_02980 [Archaeoglobus sp.]|nr:hypothetical protein [Archaeoglobus sp.]
MIYFKSGDVLKEIELLQNKTAKIIQEHLPIKGIAKRWGDEIYFETPINISEPEDSREVVEVGDVAYWIPGKAICIFFGKTPISDDKIRPASPVNLFGKIKDVSGLERIEEGDEVLIFKE